MLKKWLKSKENGRQRLYEYNENDNEIEISSTDSNELERTRSRSTVSRSSKSSFSRKKRFKASLCFGSTSDCDKPDSDNENSENSKKEGFTSKNSEQEKKGRKITNRTFRTQSDAWNFFTKINDKNVCCNICEKMFKNCGNTTNFLTHVKTQHAHKYERYLHDSSDSEGLCPENSKLNTSKNFTDYNTQKKSIKHLFKNMIPYEKNSKKKKELDWKLAVMVAKDFQPLSIVEDEGFRDFVKALNPRYEIISRKTLTNSVLPDCYEMAKKNLKSLLEKAHSVSLTVDGWTSNVNESYLGITCHFFEEISDSSLTLHSIALDIILIEKDETAHNISQLIKNCLIEWDIFDKVNNIVTDNAANMKLSVDLFNKKHFPCFAHSLDLVLKNAITKCNNDEVLSVITKCKTLVTFFHHSTKATRMLKEANKKIAEEGENAPGKLIQYIDTRWNTLHHMISSVLDNHNGIQMIKLIDAYSDLNILTKEEVQLMRQIIMILESFDQATKNISGAEYISISLVIRCIKGIILKLQAVHKTLSYPAAISFYETIIKLIDEKIMHYKQRTISKVATLIDPRFKKVEFHSEANYGDSVHVLQNLLAAQLKASNHMKTNVNVTHLNTNNKSTGIFSFIESSPQSCTISVDNIILVRNFLSCPNINLLEEPIHYLKTRHPEIYLIALKYLCTPGSSVPVERLFSATEYIISERRNRLSPKNVQMPSFLNKNYKLII